MATAIWFEWIIRNTVEGGIEFRCRLLQKNSKHNRTWKYSAKIRQKVSIPTKHTNWIQEHFYSRVTLCWFDSWLYISWNKSWGCGKVNWKFVSSHPMFCTDISDTVNWPVGKYPTFYSSNVYSMWGKYGWFARKIKHIYNATLYRNYVKNTLAYVIYVHT